MKEEPRLFKYFHEIESRPSFDDSTSITLSNFHSIIGEYHFDEEVKCQVCKSDGNCGQKHLHGWLGKTKNGKEGLIGGHCASKYFNADKNFARERSRVRRELNISKYIDQLTKLLKDKNSYITQIKTETSRLIFVRDSVRSIADSLPEPAIKVLRDMSKTGNRSVSIQVQYIEKDEKGKEIVEWIDQSIGTVAGVGVWDASRFKTTYIQLKEIRDVANSVEIDRKAGERRLKRALDVLSELPKCASRIDDLEKDLDNFATFDNFSTICFLVRNQQHQAAIAQYALKYNGYESPSIVDAKKLLSEISTKIRKAYNNRNFRVT